MSRLRLKGINEGHRVCKGQIFHSVKNLVAVMSVLFVVVVVDEGVCVCV